MTMPSPPGGFGPPDQQPPAQHPTTHGAPLMDAASAGPPVAPIPPPPSRTQKSRAAGIALGGVVTLLVVGGSATGILLCTGGKKFDTRVPLEKAPPVTIAAMGGPAHGDLAPSDAATKEAMTSALAARFCGGTDIVGELFAARYRDAASAVAPLVGLRDPLSLTDPLKCGKTLAEAMEGRTIVQLGVLDGQEPRRVAAIKHKASLPPFVGFIENSFGSLLGRCTPPRSESKAASGSSCGENGAAGFEHAGVYYGGNTADVAFFAGAFRANGGGNAEGEPASTLAALAKKLDPADSWDLRYRPESIDLALPCTVAAPSDGVAELVALCLPPGHEKDGALLAADVKATATLRERPEGGKAVGFEYVLWARDADAAKSAETKLNRYVDAWTKTVSQNEAAMLKVIASGKDPRDAVFRAVARTWLDAMKKPVVTVSGDRVELTIRKELLEDDKAQIKALMVATSEDVQKAGVIIGALLEAKSPDTEVLSHFLGPDLAMWLLAEDATVADCKAIAAHANHMSDAPDFPNDLFLPMTEIIESWGGAVPETEREEMKIEEKVCTSRRLPAETKKCLMEAKTIPEMNKCPVPVSPDTATFRTRIQGKWRATSSLIGGDVRDRQKMAGHVAGSMFVVEGNKADMSGGYANMEGDLGFVYVRTNVTSEMGDEATMARIKIGSRRVELTFVGDKLYFATWDNETGKKMPTVLLERVTEED